MIRLFLIFPKRKKSISFNPIPLLTMKFSKLFTSILLFLFFLLPHLSLDANLRKDLMLHNEEGYNYALSLPANYSENKTYVLAICLHGLNGSGLSLIRPLAPYAHYMNMILACPDGNIPDPNRNSTKWGYAGSTEYLIGFLKFMKSKYKVHPSVVLIGFSQGGNQGLYMALRNPSLWPYFISISGGYSDIPTKYLSNARKVKIFFFSGDTGPGEIYTKNKMDSRFDVLRKFKTTKRFILKGHEHKVNHRVAYYSLKWFAEVSGMYKKSFWIHKGDFLEHFENGEKFFKDNDYENAYSEFSKCIHINPVFPPGIARFSNTAILSGEMQAFKSSFFSSLEFHTNDPYFRRKEIFQLIDQIPDLVSRDPVLIQDMIGFLEQGFADSEDKMDSYFISEMYYLIGHLYRGDGNQEKYLENMNNAKFHFSQLDEDSFFYQEAEVNRKLDAISSIE